MSSGRACVGAFDLQSKRNLRLLTATGANQLDSTAFQVGQLWNVEFHFKSDCRAPHVEDVLVQTATLCGQQHHLSQFIRANCAVVVGPTSTTFGGLLQQDHSGGAVYITGQSGLPAGSVCFWEADFELERNDYQSKAKFRYLNPTAQEDAVIPYVGFQSPPARITTGTLVRLSLARWWQTPDASARSDEKCYLQVSGMYA